MRSSWNSLIRDTINIGRNCIGRNGGKLYLQKQGGAIGWKSILATWSEDLLSDYNLRYEYGKIILQMPKIWIFEFLMGIFLNKNTFFGQNHQNFVKWQFHTLSKDEILDILNIFLIKTLIFWWKWQKFVILRKFQRIYWLMNK